MDGLIAVTRRYNQTKPLSSNPWVALFARLQAKIRLNENYLKDFEIPPVSLM
jgi:hypothetical protein